MSPQSEPEPPVADLLTDSTSEEEAGDAANADAPVRTRQRRSNSAQHRDRRGQRRALAPQAAPASERAAAADAALRTPAAAKLRPLDRKSGVEGKSWSVGVNLGGGRVITQ